MDEGEAQLCADCSPEGSTYCFWFARGGLHTEPRSYATHCKILPTALEISKRKLSAIGWYYFLYWGKDPPSPLSLSILGASPQAPSGWQAIGLHLWMYIGGLAPKPPLIKTRVGDSVSSFYLASNIGALPQTPAVVLVPAEVTLCARICWLTRESSPEGTCGGLYCCEAVLGPAESTIILGEDPQTPRGGPITKTNKLVLLYWGC